MVEEEEKRERRGWSDDGTRELLCSDKPANRNLKSRPVGDLRSAQHGARGSSSEEQPHHRQQHARSDAEP